MGEILIVDDERALRDGLKTVLQGEGYSVRTARDGEDALKKIGERRPDLVLLDVMMPRMNGFRCCEEIRRQDAALPILFLTAKEGEADEIRGIGMGADDYIAKTASDAVLLARIGRAIARAKETGSPRPAGGRAIAVGPVKVSLEDFSVRRGGKEIARLTKTEADLLCVLDAHRGEILVMDDLITELRGNGFACEDSMLYVHMCNLRQKLGPAAAAIVNRRSSGYCLK